MSDTPEPSGWRTDRAKHLALCKRRALEYLDAGDLHNAFASMVSDLSKHKETAIQPGSPLVALGMMYVIDHAERDPRRWIEGFR